MQNDFISGSLGGTAAASIVANVVNKIAQSDNSVLFTRDTHGADYFNTQEGKRLPVEHCRIGSTGWELASEISKFSDGCPIFDKTSFASTDLIEYLQKTYGQEIEEIELIGLCTDICVISNAILLKAYFPEVTISVDASCCAGVTIQSHKNALEAMKMCQIVINNM